MGESGDVHDLVIRQGKSEAETEAEAMMREKAEVIERARGETGAKARAEDDMRKQV